MMVKMASIPRSQSETDVAAALAKLRSCAAIAARPLGETEMKRAAEMLDHIELVPDVGDLVRALC
jgi:hypothetical protein